MPACFGFCETRSCPDFGDCRLLPVFWHHNHNRRNFATVIALFPLASHVGPLWEPRCYAQIGGLTAATFITLLLVPVIYAIAVLDLKVVKWTSGDASKRHTVPEPLGIYS
jgi:hypothetical protein